MVTIVEIIRLEENDTDGTFGMLRVNKSVFCATLEPPDRLNAVGLSCIPAQQYLCDRYSSARFPSTFIVRNVPGRSAILFHAGNTVKDTQGCILLGETIAKLRGDRGIKNSGATFSAFMAEMNGQLGFHLTIYQQY
jgi:hypothetical protein